ncbi:MULTISPECIES: hypothetical protein [unclassified Rhizobium]|uniref:hypothetical protein n=1 Tax=unclassified Rhizobium TaxID=2613769 RepID=UPI000EA9C050|nr:MULTISPECIES: hypothetical protein [unclassified Rhizobium]AYG69840.1 hypothetical protein CCGE531_27505 [Rhizobium sp. CCGE531]AYG76220.1 hypothetical protein CCGE532_26995 [Rhizobium sp. CCGE532]
MLASKRLSILPAGYGLLIFAALTSAGSVAAPASAKDRIALKSDVPGLKITRLAKLPDAPDSGSSGAPSCGVLPETKSAGGKIASDLGWGVTGEAKLGPYEAVSFAGEFDQAAGSACAIDQGNVALFDGSNLLALIYADKSSKLTIGRITAVKDHLRLLAGDLVQMPIGEIWLGEGRDVDVKPLAAEEQVCDGKTVVPNVHGKPITEARQAIIGKGWQPFQSPPPSDPDPFGDSIRKMGIVEATDCAGTGLAYCSYYYRKGDMELDVSSFGDGTPTVSDYDAVCERSKWHKAQ